MGFITRKTAIVGIAELGEPRATHKTQFQIHAEMAKKALEDAGLTLKDVDAYFSSCIYGYSIMPAVILPEYLGIRPTYVDSTDIGGASFVAHVGHAAAAIAAGMCQVALITYGATPWSSGQAIGTEGLVISEPPYQFELPYGPTVVGNYALAAQRHAHLFGSTDAQRAEISVATRKWATMNPNAMFRAPITINDVLKSRVVASPLHVLECCVISDGGGAVVVTSAEQAKHLKQPPIYILGAGEAVSHDTMSQMPDVTDLPAKYSGEKAFKMAGLKPQDVDVAELYDSFTITVMVALEGLGFCPVGESGNFVSEQRTAPGGAFPMNTDGGGLSSCHPGERGIFLVIEAVRQLRGGRGPAQVPNARVALAHGTGGNLSSGATLLLGND